MFLLIDFPFVKMGLDPSPRVNCALQFYAPTGALKKQ